MSAYAALVSLLQILGTILDPAGGVRIIIHSRSQLESLHEKVIVLLAFLENSSSYKEASRITALQTKMREATYKAEDAIEFQIRMSRIRNSDTTTLRSSMKYTFRYFRYAVLVFMLSSNMFRVSFTEVIIPVWIQLILLSGIAAVAACTIAAVFFRLALQVYDFPDQEAQQELRRALYDFEIIEEDVSSDHEMSAYEPLVALRQTLDSVLASGGYMYSRNQLKSLHEKVTFLLRFLENASSSTCMRSHLVMGALNAKIRDAANEAKYLIKFKIPEEFIQDSERRSFRGLMKLSLHSSLYLLPFFTVFTIFMLRHMKYYQLLISTHEVVPVWMVHFISIFVLSFGSFGLCMSSVVVVRLALAATINSEAQENQELRQIMDDLSISKQNAIKIKDDCGNLAEMPVATAAATVSSRRDSGGNGKNAVVGLERDLERIRTRLVQDSSELEVVSIVGMGGIGKTTLASQVYNDPYIVSHFDICAWVTVSQEHSLRQVLLTLLDHVKIPTKQLEEDNINDEILGVHLFQFLKSRRYLIVMDDLWDKEIWNKMRIYFPDDCNNSRVLLTSRLSNVDSGIHLHKMQCLNESESWYLLREKVFGAQACPSELEAIGREIARGCRGLPLAIVVIGGVLCKDNRIKTWREVAQNLNSKLRQTEEHCLETLGLSYKYLPHELRPCFLYMGVFPEDCEIPVSRLINLWVAEGFLKPRTSEKSLEEVAEEYLDHLIDRNLIMVCKRSCNGMIRTCSIHDLLRDVSVQNAQKENFLHVLDWGVYVTQERLGCVPRRLSISTAADLQVNVRHDLNVRSFICIATKFLNYPSVVHLGFLHLRVLDILELHFGEFPEQIVKLLLLRYLAFHSDGLLPPSISNLHNLQTIIHHHCSSSKYPLLPGVIWSMPNLRHFYVKPGCYMSDPLCYRFIPCMRSSVYVVLEHLQTLVGITNLRWSKDIIKRIPNLKKLVILYDVSSSVNWSTYQLKTLVDLKILETLKITIEYDEERSSAISHDGPKLAFPQTLRKLSLSGCGIPWESIGVLPKLEALKLRCNTCSSRSWKTDEGEFPQLTFLLLEQISFKWWETEEDHFPRLKCLVIKSCGELKMIPSAVGYILTLEMIELVDCLPSAVDSAKQIQQEQEKEGNVDLKVRILKA
ncbi:hypothetical protein C2S51_019459 [Perilla frutescens var. frutescens]|nr:hypothetical protein C2S51_019459 [Perilla frutescens var. frutescens]